jgi:hypothetical protein
MGAGSDAADDQAVSYTVLGATPPAFGGVKERVVEQFDLLVAQPADADPAEDRNDVPFQLRS